MSKEFKGDLVINRIRVKGTAPWKTIMCEDTSQISRTAAISEKKTKCATYSAVSNDAVKVTGSGVVVGDLTANQVSYQQMAIWLDAGTLLEFLRHNDSDGNTIASGEGTYAEFDAYVTEATETSAVGEVSSFNWAVTSTGTITLSPIS